MPSTFSPNLRIELIGVGEQANTWGITTNTNLGTVIEQAICGLYSADVTTGDVTLTEAYGASDEARNMIIEIIGLPMAAHTVFVPDVSKVYVVANFTSYDMDITVDGGTGAAVTIGAGQQGFVYTDGVDTYSVGISQTYVDNRVVPVLNRNGSTTTNVVLTSA